MYIINTIITLLRQNTTEDFSDDAMAVIGEYYQLSAKKTGFIDESLEK